MSKKIFKSKIFVYCILSLTMLFSGFINNNNIITAKADELTSIKKTILVNNIKYTISNEDNFATVKGYYNAPVGDICIPSIIEYAGTSYTVTELGNNAFEDCDLMDSITLPNCLTKIGYRAFANCTNLNKINIPDSVNSIDAECFSKCENLESISLPDNILEISYICEDCKHLKSIKLPSNLKTIVGSAFANCVNLETIFIPDTVTSFSMPSLCGAFHNCKNLKSIHLSKNLKHIPEETFEGCENLNLVNLPNNTTKVNETNLKENASDKLTTNIEITLDGLNKYTVSVETQKYINIDGTEQNLGQPHRKAYSNSVRGRVEIANELAEPYLSAVMAVWGDIPTVVET